MRVIREILLTEYIGAILVAVLIADAFSAFISTAAGQLSYYLHFGRHAPVLNGHGFSTTYSLLGALTRVVLFLVSAYLIARWLYPGKNPPSPSRHLEEQ
jgi:ABC-type sulfate transport system permease component